MTKNVTDSKLAHYFCWMHDVTQRVLKGSLSVDDVMTALQPLINKTHLSIDSFGRFDVHPDGSFKVKVTVDRSLTPLQAFKGITKHQEFINYTVVDGMPLGIDKEVILHFFPIKKPLSCIECEKELLSRSLKSDPMAQAAYNDANETFSKEYPNVTQWRNAARNLCYAIWPNGNGRCKVFVDESGDVWYIYGFACGVSTLD